LKYYTKEEKILKIPNLSAYGLLAEKGKEYKNAIAYNYFGKTATYTQFLKQIDEAARAYRCQGIRVGDVVTVCMPNTPEAVITFYALNKIGAIANMIHPLSGEKEIKEYLNSTGSVMLVMIDICYEKIKNIISETKVYKTVVVSAKDSMPALMSIGYSLTKGFKVEKPKSSQEYVYWKDFIKKYGKYNGKYEVKTDKDTPAVILHSGGTTGTPKGIVASNQAFNAMALQARAPLRGFGLGDSVLAVMPVFHGFGLCVSIHIPLILGAHVILMPQFNYKKFDNVITKYKPTLIIGVPVMFESLAEQNPNIDMSFVKFMVSGGDSLSLSSIKKVDDFLASHGCKVKIVQGYGMTESLAGTAFGLAECNKPGSIGIPLPGNYYKFVKPGTHEEVPTGVDGEICVTGPTLMLGYLNNEKETNEMLQKHDDGHIWLHTGDMGCIDEDGVVFYKLRIKRMLVSSGYNVYPKYIEDVIEEHEAVLKCTVIGIPHPHKGEVAKAFIVLKNDFKESYVLKKSIKEHCEKHLAKYSIPYEYEFRESLPKTLIGKVDFKKLQEEANSKKEDKDLEV